ncbi:hypothetical protein HanXRQr2_Chr11g0487781 [Helianthus annuus]|uniref:Uncharacterized protein n=1 Tax=Helianthus annuus TaxID=4232 RepID=A0A9K3MZU2_HELAN|nr:hypothetical protein HanXRQr2_Chr11g0487781 [Helianthus annuus]KAJ0874912.1 hypothetical protein HanPSC8_Chr11g0469951 [Helianthus annuus]
MCRRLSLQCICFLEVISLKKVFQTSSLSRYGLSTSSFFSSLLPYFQNTILNPSSPPPLPPPS